MSFQGQTRNKCAVCNSPAQWEVWKAPLCIECHTGWIRDERFSAGAINAALGISDRVEDFTEANHKRYCVEAERRTRAWVGESRKARAA